MEFKIITKDPLNILSSTKPIVEQLKFIKFDFSKIDEVASRIKTKIDEGLDDINAIFGTSGNYEQEELLVPGLIFDIQYTPDNYYGKQKVVVLLVKDIVDSQPTIEPRIME